jgi:hypothetical protein
MTRLHPDLATISDAVEIVSTTSYRVLDNPRDLTAETKVALGRSSSRVVALAQDLYERLYIRPSESSAPRGSEWLAERNFLATLSSANRGRGTWDPDWSVRQIGADGRVAVGLHDLVVWADERDVRTATGRIAAGDPCRLRVPKEMRYLMRGFFYVFGDRDEDEFKSSAEGAVEPQWRYYWHLTSDSAAHFIAEATSILNDNAIPFRLKVLRYPTDYCRADAGVLYVRRPIAREIGDLIRGIYDTVGRGLRPQVPLLTHRLADGLALVEVAPASSSYGQQRCHLIAEALWRSFAAGHGRAERLNNMEAAFQQECLDPGHPYLARGSKLDSFGPDIRSDCANANNTRRHEPGHLALDTESWNGASFSPLDAAVKIGRSLCKMAHWDRSGQLCNWMGQSPKEISASGAIIPVAEALGPELYGGSAGIALYLAQLYALTGDAEFRHTAQAAIARSLCQALDRPNKLPSPLSVFLGQLGVVYAANRVTELTGQDCIHLRSEALLDLFHGEIDKPHPLDFIGGNAGAIPALLDLSSELAPNPTGDRYLALAIALGEQLCREAIRDKHIWCWHTGLVGDSEQPDVPLTGMSHGASGIAVALLELHTVTGRPLFLEAARGAFAYEDSLFDAKMRNWPDLRESNDHGTTPSSPRYLRVWCHGAPGIALARLRAATLDPGHTEVHVAMARAAVSTTLLAIDENLPRPRHDASLCHGLAGLIETLLCAGRQLGDAHCLNRAGSTARVLISRHGQSCDYPSGLISGGANPSLLLGVAGTGYAFLRLHAAEQVPSVLLVGFRGPELRDETSSQAVRCSAENLIY